MNFDWIGQTITSILPYKGYIALALGWFSHIYIPYLVRTYPYVSTNGGVLGIARAYLFGKKNSNTTTNPTTPT